MMTFMWNVVLLTIAIVVVRISHWLYRWSNPDPNYTGKLPPGSMGFPIIGETIDFFKPHGFYEIQPFYKKRLLRYGPLFRTNILGSKTVFSTDRDINFEIFRQENQSFVFSYPDMFVKVLGKDNLFFKTGNIHKQIKKITLHLLGVDGLKGKMIGNMDQATREHLRSKAREGPFSVRDAVIKLVMASMTPKMISNLKLETQTKLIDKFMAFSHDWFQSPFTLSTWKALHKVFKARREATRMIKDVFKRRKESKQKHGDFLDTVLEELEKEDTILDEGSAISLIFSLLVLAKEGPANGIALALKFISKNPKVLTELKREHKAIIENRKDKDAEVSWEEYRHNMTFTNMVINETLRMANLTSVMFRKAVNDVEIKGYTIPAGWIVAVSPSLVHFDEAIYEYPLEFNPWRWKGKEMVWGSKTFMVFGGGVRLCAGAEFARLQIAIFLHHLVAYYDFSVVQECELIRAPFLHFTKDLLINISTSLPSEPPCTSKS